MRVELLVDGELAARGYTEGDAVVVDEEMPGWAWADRITNEQVREIGGRLTVREDKRIPIKSMSITVDENHVMHFGPGWIRRHR